MQDFYFENCTKVWFGYDTVKKNLPQILNGYGKKVMLTYGGGSIKKNGIYDIVTSILKDAQKEIIEFSGIMSNPTYQKVLDGAKLAKENNVDLILAVGGGSVMDASKTISLAARYDGDVWNDFFTKKGEIDFSPIPVGVIVTVAGTGSECNGGSVITNEDLHIKTGRDYPKLNPEFALLDPPFTYSVPRKQVISGAFDTLSHIMETYFSKPNDNNVSDAISEALMKNVIENINVICDDLTNDIARRNLMWDATMGENRIIKLGKTTDFECHFIEHQIGAYTNCNHGEGLAVIHPIYYKYIYKYGLSKFVSFAKNVWNVNGKDKSDEEIALEGINKLAEFIRKIGLPTSLKELGLQDKSMLKEIADSCGISQGSFKQMTYDEILELLEECYE